MYNMRVLPSHSLLKMTANENFITDLINEIDFHVILAGYPFTHCFGGGGEGGWGGSLATFCQARK